jgi:hypothetical protein
MEAYRDYATAPPRYVIHTPVLFEEWVKWAGQTMELKMHEQKDKSEFIKPLGQIDAPHWVKYDFKDLEGFYQYYNKLIVHDEED